MSEEQKSYNQEESQFTLSDILSLIFNHKWWFVLSVIICMGLAVFYLYRSPKTYSRTAKVVITEDGESMAMKELSSFTGGPMSRLRSGTNVNNEVEALASPDLMEQVIKRLNLETSYNEKQLLRTVNLYTNTPVMMSPVGGNPLTSFSFLIKRAGVGADSTFILSDFKVAGEEIESAPIEGRTRDTLVTPVGSIIISKTVNFDQWQNDIAISWTNARSLAKSYCGRLTTNVSNKQTSVIVLTFQDNHASKAENVLTTLIDVYDEEWVNNKNRAARNTTAFINDRLVVIEQELGGIETNLKDYKQKNNLTDIKAVSQVYLNESSEYASKAFEVSNQVSIARYIKEYLNDPAHNLSLIPANLGLSSANVETRIAEYNEMLLKRERLLASSTTSNPLIVDMTNSLDAMRVAIARSIDNLIATLNLQASQIESQEKQIMSHISTSSNQELQLLSIERQQKVKESLYIFLLQKREENEIASLVNVGNTRRIVSPNGSPSPVSPNRMMIAFAALVLGMGIPFGIIWLRMSLDNKIVGRSDIADLSMPFLAELPIVGSDKKGIRGPERYNNDNCQIFVRHGCKDAINEAFRVLRTNLDMMARSSKSNTIMLTSLNPNAGKTFTIMNLAASMALRDKKVLMIDLDMRKKTLSNAFKCGKVGVAGYLSLQEDDLDSITVQVKDNLFLLPVGKMPPNPVELLASERFTDMISTLKQQYDYVFIDCPPIDIVADTSIIAPAADMTCLVLRAGLLDRRSLPYIETLKDNEAFHRMSVILNGVDIVSNSYRYGRYGYGSYGYGRYGYGNYGNDKKS